MSGALVREAGTATAADPPDLLTVAEVAERLKMSPKWVYAHQRRLGVIKLGDGPKARLRFDPRAVEELRQPDAGPDPIAAPPSSRPGRREAAGASSRGHCLLWTPRLVGRRVGSR
jgi:hypothetical protein